MDNNALDGGWNKKQSQSVLKKMAGYTRKRRMGTSHPVACSQVGWTCTPPLLLVLVQQLQREGALRQVSKKGSGDVVKGPEDPDPWA